MPLGSEIIHPANNKSIIEEQDHSACGVGMIVNLPKALEAKGLVLEKSHQIVKDGLTVLANFDYRSGTNPATEESDGAGIRFYGLSSAFFNKQQAGLNLQDGHFAVGQYFFPTDQAEEEHAKRLIEANASLHGLSVVGWRNLSPAINPEVLSDSSREKLPAMWQAILTKNEGDASFNLEDAVLKASLDIYNQAKDENSSLYIVSMSSESIVYKGMIRPEQMANFYLDLQDDDFTAFATTVHGRFATNTDPQFKNAQPCPDYASHNGELGSKRANGTEMSQELNERQFKGKYPDKSLSDSMQFDADLLNNVVMRGISLAEAFIRLMPPPRSSDYSDEINAMLSYFEKERSPYNGPAFIVAGSSGYYMAKLDECGLRPSWIVLIERPDGTRQLHAASDDYLKESSTLKIISKKHLAPGGMVMVTPEGNILDTPEILSFISSRYPSGSDDYFQTIYKATTCPLVTEESTAIPRLTLHPFLKLSDLQRTLSSAGWDDESITQVLRPMAERGMESVVAMGDDTNPLHSTRPPAHISYFFHQLHAQVSSPPLDSIKERHRFSLKTALGPTPGSVPNAKQIALNSPILGADLLHHLEHHSKVSHALLDMSFELPDSDHELGTDELTQLMSQAIQKLVLDAEQAALMGHGVLILSDRDANPRRMVIPDMIAVAAVRKHLESKHLSRRASIVADSYQITGPHQAATLLAVGAKAVYPRGAYAMIGELYKDDISVKSNLYRNAQEKCLLKTMGKMGITNVNNYSNGQLIGAVGLDLSIDESPIAERPSLGNIFGGLYSPLKGYHFGHVSKALLERHTFAHSKTEDFTVMPRSGFYMPEKNGIEHGYGPVVINAFTDWLKEEDLRAKLYQLDTILSRKGFPGFVADPSQFSPEQGFLDPRRKNDGNPVGTYPQDYLETLKVSPAFRVMSEILDRYKRKHPSSIRDHFSVKKMKKAMVQELLNLSSEEPVSLQSTADIRKHLFSGSMSQGALTFEAHKALSSGVNAVHAMSAAGEGGEDFDEIRDPLISTKSKQFASGRFGNSAMQILLAEEIEIKVAQGAKPGEGGELSGLKVWIRTAAQRGGLPGTPFISPPPHHDIYSIEDLKQLIEDIKSVKPGINVVVKLVAAEGIGTIAVGVAKAGADVINIASNSGGTAAGQQSSIKHAGFPGELGLAEVDSALRKTKLRDLVKLRTSGGIKTADDIILSAILGADDFELGTTSMLTLNCKMLRKCNEGCTPGVATDGHLFKGDKVNTERYFVNLAAAVQERLVEMGIPDLKALRGRTELLELIDPEILKLYDFSALLNRQDLPPPLTAAELVKAKERRQAQFKREKEDALVLKIQAFFDQDPSGVFCSDLIELTPQDRSFGGRIAGAFAAYLEAHPDAKIILNTHGIGGQSLGFVTPKGLEIHHSGTVLDGCAKSMTGGELIIRSPIQRDDYRADENAISGNAMLYGASGGRAYINGVAGHRFGILMKGTEVVVEGVGDLAFEYMTSGTGMILGQVGKDLCAGASGGVVFVYNKDNKCQSSDSVINLSIEERQAYTSAIQGMLEEHLKKTGSLKATEILAGFDVSQFSVLIPTIMDKIQSFQDLLNIIKTYELRRGPLTAGMQVWLEQKLLKIVPTLNGSELDELHSLLLGLKRPLFSPDVYTKLLEPSKKPVLSKAEPPPSQAVAYPEVKIHIRKLKPKEERLKTIAGGLDHTLFDGLSKISAYVSALNKDATGCTACRIQSCAGGEEVSSGCPGGKAINTINETLKLIGKISDDGLLTEEQWKLLRRAFEVQIKETPFISYTGAACPAPCQDACKQTIPGLNLTDKEPTSDVKPVGEAVHIKDIEYYLYQIGRSLGWFDGKKVWSEADMLGIFGGNERIKRHTYDKAIFEFKPPFRKAVRQLDKELVVVGSGPAAMQIAFEALRDGVKVRMYEKSDRPGGLLADGIPAHKFDKKYLEEDFNYLIEMGLELHVNSDVFYDAEASEYRIVGDVTNKVIASSSNENQHVALCLGAGLPKILPKKVTASLNPTDEPKIIQAVDFLKAANDLADLLKKNDLSDEAREALIQTKLGHMDPRGKKVVVVGGADTAQDAIRWVARYFNQGAEGEQENNELVHLVRGPPLVERAVLDGYPSPARAPTKENALRAEELEYVNGHAEHMVEPTAIRSSALGKLSVEIADSKFQYYNEIQADPVAKKLFDALPRERKPLERKDGTTIEKRTIERVDMVICALGFQGKNSIPLVQAVERANLKRFHIAGDSASEESKEPQIIIGAQVNGKNIYKKIRASMGIDSVKKSVLVGQSMFRPADIDSGSRAGSAHIAPGAQVARW